MKSATLFLTMLITFNFKRNQDSKHEKHTESSMCTPSARPCQACSYCWRSR